MAGPRRPDRWVSHPRISPSTKIGGRTTAADCQQSVHVEPEGVHRGEDQCADDEGETLSVALESPEQHTPEHQLFGDRGQDYRGEDQAHLEEHRVGAGDEVGYLLRGLAVGEEEIAQREQEQRHGNLQDEADADVDDVPRLDAEAQVRAVLASGEEGIRTEAPHVLAGEAEDQDEIVVPQGRPGGDEHAGSEQTAEPDEDEVDDRPGP